MDQQLSGLLGNALSLLGLLCFVAGAGMLVTGAPVDSTIYALGALAIIFVGAGSSMRNRSGPPTT